MANEANFTVSPQGGTMQTTTDAQGPVGGGLGLGSDITNALKQMLYAKLVPKSAPATPGAQGRLLGGKVPEAPPSLRSFGGPSGPSGLSAAPLPNPQDEYEPVFVKPTPYGSGGYMQVPAGTPGAVAGGYVKKGQGMAPPNNAMMTGGGAPAPAGESDFEAYKKRAAADLSSLQTTGGY